jgi:hypothetical protein
MPITTIFRRKPNIVGSGDGSDCGCCSHGIAAADAAEGGAAEGGAAEAALTNSLLQFAQNLASGKFGAPQFRQYFSSVIIPP